MEKLPLDLFYDLILKVEGASLLKLCNSSLTLHKLCNDQSERN